MSSTSLEARFQFATGWIPQLYPGCKDYLYRKSNRRVVVRERRASEFCAHWKVSVCWARRHSCVQRHEMTGSTALQVHQTKEELISSLCEELKTVLCERPTGPEATSGKTVVAVSGGSLPSLLGAAVARIPKGTVDFSETFWIMVDERVVPKNHLDSNYRAVCEALSEFVSTSQILGIPDEALKTGATDLIAHEYEALLRARGIMPSAVALVLLGMGEDGHTASLFPHMSVELTNSPNSSFYIGVDDSPKAPPKRITLTLSAIHAAQKRVFVVTGKGKAAAIAHIFREGNSRRLPAGLVQDALWLVDEAAVSASSES